MDANGNALVVWRQSNGSVVDIMSSRYIAGGGWGTAAPIATSPRDAYEPRIATNASSDAIAVWTELEGSHFGVWSSRYTSFGGWGAVERLDSLSGGDPRLALDPSGDAMVVWTRYISFDSHEVWSTQLE